MTDEAYEAFMDANYGPTEYEKAEQHSKKTVTISLVKYEGLLAESRLLQALENAGVDNWDGYYYAMDELREAGEFDD